MRSPLALARPRDPASPHSEAATRRILAALDRSLKPAQAAAPTEAAQWW